MLSEIEIAVIFDFQVQDPATVLWSAADEDGHWVALLEVPIMWGYVIAKRDAPFIEIDGEPVRPLDFDDHTLEYFELARPEAGQLGIALVTALINNSDQLISSYSQQLRAR
jgi:hypothetical protein